MSTRRLRASIHVDALEARRLFTSVTGYLPDYHFDVYTKLDYDTLDSINYFSLKPDAATGRLPGTKSSSAPDAPPLTAVSSDGESLSNLTTLVSYAHNRGVKVNIVIGGAGENDDALDSIIADSSLHAAFAQSVQEFAAKYHVDGVDLDWEEYDTTDAQITNYAAFIDTIHDNNTANLHFSAAVYPLGVETSSGQHKQLTSGAIADLDQINVMNYDYDPAQGNHSPLSDTQAAMNSWATVALKSKLGYGMPFYGRHGPGYGFELSYADIIAGYKDLNGANAWPAANVDSISFGGNTWGFNGRGTIQTKTEWAKNNNFAGVMVWDLGHDLYTDNKPDETYSLMAAIKRGLDDDQGPQTGGIKGKVTAGGAALSGVQVYIDSDGDKVLDASEARTTTDAFGYYLFSDVPVNPDLIVRQIVKSGYEQITPSSNYGRHANVTAGELTENVDFVDRKLATAGVGTVKGTVTSDGKAFANVTVFYDVDNDQFLDTNELRAVSNSSGNYTLTNVPAGSGRIIREVIPAGYYQLTPSIAGYSVTIAAGQTVSGKNFTNTPIKYTTINGTVFNDKNGNGKKDSGETGFSGWKVFIDADGDKVADANEYAVTTNASGAFSFVGLASGGTFKIRVVKPSGYVQTSPSNNYGRDVTVATGKTVSGVLFGAKKI